MDDVAGLIRNGQLDKVEHQLNQDRGAAESSARWQYHWGLLQEARGEHQAAIDAFSKARELDANHIDATFRLAYNLDLHGDEETAIELYIALTERSPAHVNALLNLAVLYEDHGDYEAALECVDRVLDEHPNHKRAAMFAQDIKSSMSMQFDESYERNLAKQNALLDTPVADFELSVRSRNCLKKMNIHTLGDLLRITEPELLSYKNFGETSLCEIKAMLKQKTLRLGQLADDSRRTSQASLAARRIAPDAPAELLNKPLSEIEFSGRSRKCLQRLNLMSVGDLIQKTEAELLSTKNFGQTSLTEIKQRLEDLGLSLRSA
jgi:DNA-directed RNA polymerase subunit alpha